MARPLGILVNLGIRLWIAYFLAEVLQIPDDPASRARRCPSAPL